MLGARDIISRNHRVVASRWSIDSARYWPTGCVSNLRHACRGHQCYSSDYQTLNAMQYTVSYKIAMTEFRTSLRVTVRMFPTLKNNSQNFYCNSKISIPHPQLCSVSHQPKRIQYITRKTFDSAYSKNSFSFLPISTGERFSALTILMEG